MSTRKLAPGAFKRVPAAFMTDIELGKPAMRVGLYLAFHADNETHECCHSTLMMADRLQMSRSLIIEALGQLVSRGHILRRRRSQAGRGQTSSAYALVFRAPAPAEIHAPEGSDMAPRETAQSDPKPSGGPPSQPASLDQSNWSPAPDDHPDRSPGGGPVTSFDEAGDQFLGGPVTSSGGHVLDSLTRKEGLDDERAHAREASSSASHDFSDEGQALLAFDEMAGRLGWPMAGRLTKRERKAMTSRLHDAGGLDGWRLAMEKAEASNYLGRTKPGLPFFLAEDTFAQLMRGRYDPDKDPEPTGMAAVFAGLSAWAAERDRTAPPEAPAPEPAPPPQPQPPDRLAINLCAIGRYSGKSWPEMRALAEGWMQQLEASGIDPSTAREIVSDEARMAPKSWSALEHLEKRIGAHVTQRRAAA